MDLPTPGPEHARLARKAGECRGDGQLEASPRGLEARRKGMAASLALVQDYEEAKDGESAFQCHGAFTIGPRNGGVLRWLDSMTPAVGSCL